ncbi:hypothetical protein [Neisseria sp. 83E34]|uniref:DUF6984 family protein n=1 Tax=Neisseria sp. 83E34 TaxID=1692264 RepID=UPI0006CE6863|nr:hypothetical protein [Neisseria sp. 83E34]KPN70577.1 hypothetical protein AKG09_11415 [Neisseria sp. 83E34]
MAYHKRLLNESEKKLLNILRENIFPEYKSMKLSFPNYVLSLNDGKMGSIKFIYDREPESCNIIPISEYRFNDIDNVPVLTTLYAYENGDLYELDIWKSDFSQLLSYPI